MPRQVVYTLLTKNGPTHEQQMAAVKRTVKLMAQDETYTDDLTRRRRASDHEYPARSTMIRQLRKGDTVVVASPGRLAIGRDAIRAVLHELERKGNWLIDASTGRRVMWTKEIEDLHSFLERGSREHKADVLRAARAAKKAAGIVYRPEKKEFLISEEAAEHVWRDTVLTRDEAAERCGVSWRTLYNRFGGRTEEMGYRPPPKVKSRRRN